MKVVPRIAVTGCSGFIGSRLVTLLEQYYKIFCIDLRNANIEDLVFDNIHAVIHLAGIAVDSDKISPKEYVEVNANLTERLAMKAKKEQIPHFVFISSVKVFEIGVDFVIDSSLDKYHDTNSYAYSKLLAERCLKEIYSEQSGLTIVRPAMVFGPNCKGNILKLISLVKNRFPLPLAKISNKRALIFVDNLVWNIDSVIKSEIFGVLNLCDHSELSTTQLVEQISSSLNLAPRIFSIPLMFRLVIKKISSKVYSSLFESNMDIDFNYIQKNLFSDYAKIFSLNESFKITTDWYLNSHG